MSGPFDKELESIANSHTQDFARKLAHEVANLILRKLGIDHASVPGATSGRKKAAKAAAPAAKAAPAKKAAAAPAKKRSNGEDRASALEKVFRVVQARDGVAVGDVVKATSLDRGPVAAALKALKEEGRIFMGGSRRFARYALSQGAADRASETARKG
jgi:hypothetical protein